ncbi:MAG: YfiR family protein [Pseudomonadota bacterium]
MSILAPLGRPLYRLALVALLSLCGAGICQAQTDRPNDESQVKAAYLYKLAGYVEWPEGALGDGDAPFTIGVLGAEPIAEELAQIASGRKVHARPIVVRRLRAGDGLDGLAVLFVGKAETARLKPLQGRLQSHSVLVVTEDEAGLALGGIINFLLVDRRVRFEVSLEPAEKRGLRLSSRMLAVAQKVHPGER